MDELSQILNRSIFNFSKFVSFFNEKVNKTILNGKSQIFLSSMTVSYLRDLFISLEGNLSFDRSKFQRAFLNLAYFNAIFTLIRPLELFSVPHLHLKFPIRYYHAFFEYSEQINKIVPMENFKSLYRINREQNCAYTVIEAFSMTDSFEQTELQRFFLRFF
jgi:hypothetical protein